MGDGTALGQVRGLGSAKEGTHHWWEQRLTAGANLILLLWFVVSIALLPDYQAATVAEWIASPWAAVPMLLLVLSVFVHIRLGLQVVIEDYVHSDTRIALLVLLNFFAIGGGVLAAFSILKIAFTGVA